MNLKEFKYSGKPRKVYVMKENNNLHKNFIQGIDLTHLTDEEQKELESIVDNYQKKLEPFVKKAFRNFSSEKIEI